MYRYAVAHYPDARMTTDSIVDKQAIFPTGLGRPVLLAFESDEARQAYLDNHGTIFNRFGYPEKYRHLEAVTEAQASEFFTPSEVMQAQKKLTSAPLSPPSAERKDCLIYGLTYDTDYMVFDLDLKERRQGVGKSDEYNPLAKVSLDKAALQVGPGGKYRLISAKGSFTAQGVISGDAGTSVEVTQV